jgi:hypothetical protein
MGGNGVNGGGRDQQSEWWLVVGGLGKALPQIRISVKLHTLKLLDLPKETD